MPFSVVRDESGYSALSCLSGISWVNRSGRFRAGYHSSSAVLDDGFEEGGMVLTMEASA